MDRDDDLPQADTDLVQLLVLEAGRIMEDASVEFALALPNEEARRAAALSCIHDVAEAAQLLVRSAIHLDRLQRGSDS